MNTFSTSRKFLFLLKSFCLFAVLALFSLAGDAAPVIFKVGPTGDYTTIKNAYDNCANPGDNYQIWIMSDYKPAEEVFPVVFTAKNSAPVLICPDPSNLDFKLLSADPTAIFVFDGAKNITVSGQPGGTLNKNLMTIENTSTTGGAFTILFNNSAQNNLVEYCIVKGSNSSNTSSTAGVICMRGTGTSTAASNIIDHCDITKSSSRPPVAINICNTGTSSSHIISNNNIYDFAENGINVSAAAANCKFTGNSFYQSPPVSTYAFPVNLIYIGAGSAYTITDNFLGGQAPQCAGLAYTISPVTFSAINFVAAAGNNTIAKNVIQNISQTTGALNSFIGIKLAGTGNFTCGGPAGNGNTIGSTNKTSISYTCNATGGSIAFTAIQNNATGTNSISDNTIAGIKISTFSPIASSIINNTAGTTTIANNAIGSSAGGPIENANNGNLNLISTSAANTTIANNTIDKTSMTSGSTTAACYALNLSGGGTVRANMIRNISHASTNTSAKLAGIEITGGSWNIQNNVIMLGSGMANNISIYGIELSTTATATSTIYHNTVAISGAAGTGTSFTAAISRPNGDIAAYTLKNNIFYNMRTGGNGFNYAEYNQATGGTYTTNNNYLQASNTAAIAFWKAAAYDITGWRTNSLATASLTGTISLDAMGKVITSPFAGGGKGANVGITTDISGVVPRNIATPWMGAYEGPTINITSLSPTSTVFCSGATLTVNFNALGSYGAGNKFIVQLSASDGTFNSPTKLDSITSSATGVGSIVCKIPAKINLAAATPFYRVRVIGTNPGIIGADNGVNLTLQQNVFTVTNTLNGSTTDNASLRWAITQVNNNPCRSYINFNLGAGPATIQLSNPLPVITAWNVTIDGFDNGANPGFPDTVAVFNTIAGKPLNPVYKVILKNISGVSKGLVLAGQSITVKGLVFQDFGVAPADTADAAIVIKSDNNKILGCYIGTDGVNKSSNTAVGLLISGKSNSIGDGTPAGTNLISGFNSNSTPAIYIFGANATTNIIRGNIIGLQKDGSTIVTGSTQQSGVYIVAGATNTISGNVISGNGYNGVYLASNGNTVTNNRIGTQANGKSIVFSNKQVNGILVTGGNNTISNNLISGNAGSGLVLDGSSTTGNTATGNTMGSDINGNAISGNAQQYGVVATNTGSGTNTVGSPANPNIISNNSTHGIYLSGSYTSIIENSIFCNPTPGIIQIDNNIFYPDLSGSITGTTTNLNVTNLPLAGSKVLYFYKNTSCNKDQGQTFVTKINVASGLSTGTYSGNAFNAGDNVTVMYTSATGSSQFSAAILLAAPANTWTGDKSTDWEDKLNWSLTAIPDASQVVMIPAGLTNYPVIKSNASVNTLYIDKSATVTISTSGQLKVADLISNEGTICEGGTLTYGTLKGNVPKSLPTAVISSNLSPICTNGFTNITVKLSPAGTTFNWFASLPPLVEGSSSGAGNETDNVIVQNLNGGNGGTAVYTIIPELDGCTGDSVDVSVVINATPSLNPVNPKPICSGDTTDITLTANPKNANFSWEIKDPNTFRISKDTTSRKQATARITASDDDVSGAVNGTGNTIKQVLTGFGSIVFDVTVSLNGCESKFNYLYQTVNQLPTVIATSDKSAICKGDSVILRASGTNVFTWSPPASLSHASSNGDSIIGRPASTVSYIVTGLDKENGCTNKDTLIVTVNSNVPPSVSITSSPASVCANTPVTFTAVPTNGGSSPSYQWKVGSSVVGTGPTYTTSTLASGNIVTVEMISTAPCVTTTKVISNSITVKPKPLVNEPVPVTLCSGSTTNIALSSSPANATFTWTVNANGVTGAAAASGGPIIQTLTGNGNVQYNVTPVLNSCTGNAVTAFVNVKPLPAVSITSPPNPKVCVGATVAFAGSPSSGGAFSWTSTTPGKGTINSAGVATGVSTGTSVVTYTFTDASGCNNTASQILTVNALPLVSITSAANPKVCTGAAVAFTGNPSSGGTFSWTSATPARATINSSGSAMGISPGSSIITYSFTDGTTGCNSAATQTLTINATPLVSITSAANPKICTGETALFTGSPSSGGTTSWTSATASTATINTSTGVATGVAGGTSVISYVFTDAATACANTASQTLTVNETPTVNPVTPSPICSGASTGIALSSSSASASFAWTVASVTPAGSVTGQVAGSGAAIINQILNNATSGSGIVRYSITATDKGCSSTPVTADQTVNPVTLITTQPALNTNLCLGAALNLSVTATGAASLTYQWEINGNAIPGATSATYQKTSVTAADAGTYRVKVTSSVTGSCSIATSNNAVVNINGVTLESSYPKDASTCSSGSASFSLNNPTGLGKLSFQWYKGTTAITGQTDQILTVDNVTTLQNGETYYVKIKDNGNCEIDSKTATLTVTNNTSINVFAVDSAAYCVGAAPITFTAQAGGLKPYTYLLTKGTSTIDASQINVASSTYTFTLTNTVAVADSGIYTLKVTSNCGAPASSKLTTTVRNSTIGTQPSDQTNICDGSVASFTVTGSALSSVQYQWQADNGTGKFSNIPGSTSSSYSLSTDTTMKNYKYRVVVSDNGACAVTSNPAVLKVTEQTVISQDIKSATLCEGNQLQLTVAATGNNLAYKWFKGTTVLASATSNYTIAATTTADAGNYSVQVIGSGTGLCGTKTSGPIPVTINAKPVINAGNDQTNVCPGQTINVKASSNTNAVTWISKGTGQLTKIDELSATYNPTTADISSGSVVLVATSANPGSCAPVKDSLTVTFGTLVSPPVNTTSAAQSTIFCNQAATLTASGTNLSWFDAVTGGNRVATNVNSYTTGKLSANVTYFVQDSTSCGVSSRTAVDVTIKKADQTITFTAIPAQAVGSVIQLTATTTSPLGIVYTSSDPAVVSITNPATATALKGGISIITATQAGDACYNPATATQQMSVNDNTKLKIVINPVGTVTFGDLPTPITTNVTASVTLTYTSSNTAVAIIRNDSIIGIRPGFVTITATNAGNNAYEAVSAPVTVAVEMPNFNIIGDKNVLENSKSDYYISPVSASCKLKFSWSYSDKAPATIIINSIDPAKFALVFLSTSARAGVLSCRITNPYISSFDSTLTLPLTMNTEINKNQLSPVSCDVIASTSNSCKGIYISQVYLSNIVNKGSLCSPGGYEDNTKSPYTSNMYLGEAYNAEIHIGNQQNSIQPNYVGVWIDYNNDGDFNDPNEFLMSSFSTDSIVRLNNLVISTNSNFAGVHRLRLKVQSSPFGQDINQGCVDSKSELGETEDYKVTLETPNNLEAPVLITPNDDGKNDLFIIKGINVKNDNKLMILDRLGSVIYTVSNYMNNWGGTDNSSTLLPQDTYYYVFTNGDNIIRGYFEIRY